MPATRFRIRRVKKRSTLSRWYSKIIKSANRAISRSVFAIRVRRKFRSLPQHLRIATIGALILVLVIPAVFLYPTTAYGASYTWSQTDWQGGTDSGTLAVHATDQTGWTKYSSISNMSGTTSPGNVALTIATFTATDSGTFASTGAATGGGFSSGTTSSTTVTGSGSTASVALTGTAFGSPWTTLAVMPGAAAAGSYMIHNDTEDWVYALRANNVASFYKFSIAGNSWTTLTSAPFTPGSTCTHMIRNGTDDLIYVQGCAGGTTFAKYSISGNSWTSLAVTPAVGSNESDMIRDGSSNNIYWHGAGNTAVFAKYSIATTGSDTANTWTTLAPTPTNCPSAQLSRAGSSDDIYIFGCTNGTNNYKTYKYSITGNSWTTMTDAPNPFATGGGVLRNGTDDAVYALSGSGTTFLKYSVSGNSWTSLTALPLGANDGSSMVRNGSSDSIYIAINNSGGSSKYFLQYSIANNTMTQLPQSPAVMSGGWMVSDFTRNTLYVLGANNSTAFWQYSLTTTPWTTLPSTAASMGDGSSMVRNGTDDAIYMLQGGGTGFYKYTISSNSFTTLAVVPGAVGAGARMIRNGSDDLIYVLRGAFSTSFYKYSISGNSWTALTTTPGAAQVDAGAQMIRNGSDNNIYVAQGKGANGFWRYSIATTGADTANTWTTLTVVPSTVGASSQMLRNGSDNNIYLAQGSNQSGFWRYSIATTGADTANTWTALTVVPASPVNGGVMIRNGSDNNMYFATGNGSNFYRYSIATTGSDTANTWTALTSIPSSPGGIHLGSFMTRNGSDDSIYLLRGNTTNTFYKYSISGNTWSEVVGAPNTITTGSFILRGTNENDMYILRGGSTGFYRYAFAGNYAASGTFTSATIDTKGVTALGNISWTNPTLPSGATLTIATRTSADGNSWSAWSGELSTAAGSAITSTVNRYIQYRATYTTSDVNESPVLSSPIINYTAYNTSGNLVSSIFNSADAANIIGGLVWTEDSSLPSGTTVTVSLRAAASSGGVAGASYSNFTNATTNCSKSTGTVTCTPASIPVGLLTNAQYFQYKIALASTNGAATPTVGSVVTTYVVNAPPQLQNVSAVQNADSTVTISYDVRDPDTANGSPANQGHVTPSFEYWNGASYSTITTLGAGDAGNKSVNIDGTTWTTQTATWTPTTDFNNQYQNNTAKVRITVNDNEAANNTVQAETATYTLDTKVPASASVVADYSDATSGNSYLATLTLAATDDTALTMVISTHSNFSSPLFSGAYATSKTVSVGNTPDSPDTIYVRFTDAKGNSTSLSAAPPARGSNMMIQDTSNTTITPAEYRLFTAWKAVSPTGFGSYKVYRSPDQSTWSLVNAIASASTNYYSDTNVSADGSYYYRIVVTNSNGDSSFVSATVTGTANGTQDPSEGSGGQQVAPTISAVTISSITPTTAKITWDTDQISNSSVGYSITAGLFNTTTTVSSMVDSALGVGQHEVILSGLTPDTTYYLSASSTNATGSTRTANNSGNGYSFTSLSGPAITATGTARTESITNTSATIVWQTSAAADSLVTFSTSPTFSSSNSTSVATMVTNHSVTLTNLSSATKYFFYVQSTDGSGNVETDKNVVEGVARYYSLTTTNDSVAPTISTISAVPQTTTAVILWTTNESATSQVEYGITNAYGTSTTLDSTLTTQHSVSLSSLTPGTLYYYRIKTSDANGNLTTGSEQTFTTGDSTAPIISSVASGSISLTGATITWTTNEQANSIVEYGTTTAYGSTAGSEVETATSHSITLSGLSGNTLYYYRVRSRDASGNLATSDNSGNGYTFTTAADTTAPVITSVTTPLVSDTSAVVTWVTNEVANARIEYGPTIAYGSSTNTSSSYTTTQTVTITGLTKSTHYYFKVISVDPSTNSTTDDHSSAGYEFTTTADPVAASSGGGGGGGFFPGDVTPPNILDVKVTNITSSSARVEWLTDEAANTMVSYNAPSQPAFLEGNSDDSAPSHVVTLTGLDAGTTYSFRPISYDGKGNKGTGELSKFTTLGKDGKVIAAPQIGTPPAPAAPVATTPTPAATSSSLLDTLKSIITNPLLSALPESTLIALLNDLSEKAISPPTIVSNKADVEVKGTVATISWSTDKKTIGMVAYGKIGEALDTKNQFSIAGNINTYNTDHKVVLDGLDPATTYKYEVQAKAAYGPEAKFVAGTFKTTTELPVIADIKLDSINDNSVTVQWKTNTPTSASVEYTNRDTRATLAQGDTSLLRDHSITIKDLLSGAPYSLVIKAADEFKNESVSGSVPFTTGKDIMAPEITKVTAESTIYPGKESRVQTIVTWTTNEPGSSQVFYQEGVGADAKAIELSKDNTLTLSHTIVVTRFAPASIYKFWVVSVDASGNSTRSKDYTILTPQQKETVVDVILKNFEQTFGWTSKLRGGP